MCVCLSVGGGLEEEGLFVTVVEWGLAWSGHFVLAVVHPPQPPWHAVQVPGAEAVGVREVFGGGFPGSCFKTLNPE